jgi:hypothetical protein
MEASMDENLSFDEKSNKWIKERGWICKICLPNKFITKKFSMRRHYANQHQHSWDPNTNQIRPMTKAEVQEAIRIKLREQQRDARRQAKQYRKAQAKRRLRNLQRLCKPVRIILVPVDPKILHRDPEPIETESEIPQPLHTSTPCHDITFFEVEVMPDQEQQENGELTTLFEVLEELDGHLASHRVPFSDSQIAPDSTEMDNTLSDVNVNLTTPRQSALTLITSDPIYSDISDASTPDASDYIIDPPSPFKDTGCHMLDADPSIDEVDLRSIISFGPYKAAEIGNEIASQMNHVLSAYEQQMLRFKFEVVERTLQLLQNLRSTTESD